MNKTTFKDAAVVAEMNKNFYAVKFDAEQKDDIDFNGSTFKFVNQGRRGIHQLAFAMLDGRAGYPSFVLMDEDNGRVRLSPGYKTTNQLMKELKFVSDEAYKKMDFEKFKM